MSDKASTIKMIGKGDKSIFLYYYPTYRKAAELQSHDTWWCRLGLTTGDVNKIDRKFLSLDVPELPEVGMIIKTDDLHCLYKVLKDVLDSMGRQDSNRLGWYMTSPDDLESIYRKYSPLIGYDPVEEDVDE